MNNSFTRTLSDKAELRRQCKARRAALSESEVQQKSAAVADLFLKSEIYNAASCIMLYMPIFNEVDTLEIMKNAHQSGKKVVLPVTDVDDNITPCCADADTGFKSGRYSVQEPVGTQTAEPDEIDIVIVPGVAFDKSGNRIGFGKGCYDKFLKATKAVKVGLCYGFQLYDEIPADLYDVKMDYVICENGINRGG